MSNMYNILKNHIAYSNFDLAKVLDRIKSLHGRLEITDEQREELETMARKYAQPTGGMDMEAKMLEIDARLHKLEAAQSNQGSAQAYDPYVEGRWYYGGDKCSWEGGNYTCIAPDGVVCVWSPGAHPAYWRKD